MKYSILFDTDAYKASHKYFYPEGTSNMFSYIEARNGGAYPKTIFFGLQYYLKEYLSKPISIEEVDKAKIFFTSMGEPFDYEGWMHIAKDLKGKLPVKIRAVAEGTAVPLSNILVSVESTDPKVFWLPSWIETSILRNCWYGTNVATVSWTIKNIIKEALSKSSDNTEAVLPFSLHDFGARGVSSQESAMLGGAAHLINFLGSDTAVASLCATEYYNATNPALSIPATEHSCIIGFKHELDAYRNVIKQFAKPGSLVACVADSYDLYNAISNLFGDSLRQEIIDSGATVIIRPDSGFPPEVVLNSVKLLDEKFGHTINSKGFKVLKNVKVIQGDGILENSIKEILNNLLSAGYSAENCSFGMGGALLQGHNRDTNRFAMKLSSITVNGEERSVSKNPKTDPGKKSKMGKLDLVANQIGELRTVERNNQSAQFSIMRTVFENGEILIDEDFETIRARANKQ